MGFSLEVSVPVITVFLQGLLSFFSPCVLPILPLYMGYLSGGTGARTEDGRILYQRGKVMVHTICFVVGISSAFFVLGLGFSAAGGFFRSNQMLFARIGGILVMLFGLYQLGLFGSFEIFGKEKRLPIRIEKLAMSPWTAFLMGFTFSFAWTPCVGPALASVLLMAASAATRKTGFFLIAVYTLGFVVPFLAAGFFTTWVLELLKKYRGVVKYTVKLGGLLLVILGLLMFTGKMNGLTGYLSQLQSVGTGDQNQSGTGETGINEAELSGQEGSENGFSSGKEAEGSIASGEKTSGGSSLSEENKRSDKHKPEDSSVLQESEKDDSQADKDREDSEQGQEESKKTADSDENKIPALDFELEDQYGEVHRLSDYEGKVIFLNFWATWCPPCKAELPDIQKLYEKYQTSEDGNVVILGVAGPNMGNEKSQEEISAFLEENGYTYPVLMDPEWDLFQGYGIYAFPTTFMIDEEGNIFGYASGQLTYDMMEDIIRQTIEGKRQ